MSINEKEASMLAANSEDGQMIVSEVFQEESGSDSQHQNGDSKSDCSTPPYSLSSEDELINQQPKMEKLESAVKEAYRRNYEGWKKGELPLVSAVNYIYNINLTNEGLETFFNECFEKNGVLIQNSKNDNHLFNKILNHEYFIGLQQWDANGLNLRSKFIAHTIHNVTIFYITYNYIVAKKYHDKNENEEFNKVSKLIQSWCSAENNFINRENRGDCYDRIYNYNASKDKVSDSNSGEREGKGNDNPLQIKEIESTNKSCSFNLEKIQNKHSFFTPKNIFVGGVFTSTSAIALTLGTMAFMHSAATAPAILTATVMAGGVAISGGLALAIGIAILGAIGIGLMAKGLHDQHQENKMIRNG